MKPLLFALATLWLMIHPARAEIRVVSTPEWLAHDAALIFVGVPVHSSSTHQEGERSQVSIRFTIAHRLKGPLSEGDTVTVSFLTWKGDKESVDFTGAIAQKRPMLVLAKPSSHSVRETDGLYHFLPGFAPRSVFFTDEPVQKVYDENGAAIRSYVQLLKHVQDQCVKEAGLRWRYLADSIQGAQVKVTFDSDAFRENAARSIVLLNTIEYIEPKK